MNNWVLTLIAILLINGLVFSQANTVEGYVFEEGNRGYLNQVTINIYNAVDNTFVGSARTNQEGFFTLDLGAKQSYKLVANKSIFEEKTMTFETESEAKTFLKVVMKREEGYLFEVTLAPKRDNEDVVVDAITGALIEVYNNTKKEEVLVLENHPSPDFKVHFKKGNHYTVLVRREGFLTKRMEAFVNVEGCILCFEGVGEVKPGVSDNLTEGMSMGTLLANVEMQPIYEGKIIEIPFVYYEFGKSELTKEGRENLGNLGAIMKDNPQLNVELGSHTDVRGTSADNLKLSDKRAKSAVDFLTGEMSIEQSRIIAKGYGESRIKNKCKAGVTCTEAEHMENRRTEIKILQMNADMVPLSSLASMKVEEEFMRQLMEGDGIQQVSYQEKEASDHENPDVDLEIPNEIKGDPAARSLNAQEDGAEVKDKNALDIDKRQVKGKEAEVENRASTTKHKVKKQESSEEEASLRENVEEAKAKEEAAQEDLRLKYLAIEEEQKAAEEQRKAQRLAAEKAQEKLRLKEDARLKAEVETLALEKKKAEFASKSSDPGLSNEGFSGYRVVVHFSSLPLSGDHDIFKRFDNVLSYETAQKNILYMVGEFRGLALAKKYQEESLAADFPSSYVVGFLNGKKINIE